METLDNILRIDETCVLDDGVATVRIVGSGDFTGDFAFSPRLHVA